MYTLLLIENTCNVCVTKCQKTKCKIVSSYKYSLICFAWKPIVREVQSFTGRSAEHAIMRIHQQLRYEDNRLKDPIFFVGVDSLTRTVWRFSKVMGESIQIEVLRWHIDNIQSIKGKIWVCTTATDGEPTTTLSKDICLERGDDKDKVTISIKCDEQIQQIECVKIVIEKINNEHWSHFFLKNYPTQIKNIDFC